MRDNIKLGYSSLTKKIYLYRHDKDDKWSLDEREVQNEVMSVFVDFMMDDSPAGDTLEVKIENKYYELSVKPIEHFSLLNNEAKTL